MLRIGRIFFVLFCMQVITACDLFIGDRCGPFNNTPLKISGLQHELARHRPGEEELIPTTEGILMAEEFGILVQLEIELIVQNSHDRGSLISSAWACSPPPPDLRGGIDSLKIYSSIPYKDGLTTDSDLTGYFNVVRAGLTRGFFRSQLPATEVSELFTNYEFTSGIYLFPTESPSDGFDNASFRVVLYLSGEGLETAEFTTAPITLWP